MILDLVAARRFLGPGVRPILPRPSELLLETLGYAGDDVRVDAPWVAGVAGARVTEPAAAFPRKEEKPV